jgi:two-component system, LytTR family, sensor kinase
MMADTTASTRRIPDVLLSWDRLGFRLLVFGCLAIPWILQGRLAGMSWHNLLLNEVGGLMPWAFLAPMVLSINSRIQRARPNAWRFLVAHAAGMVLVFIPYWIILRGISLGWRCLTSGWQANQLTALVPTTQNVLGAFLSVPFVYFLILLGAEAMKHARARQEESTQAERLARQLSDARLALLQRQLHPHFLFNALQAISTLLHRDPATADRLLVRLSDLLRAMLDDASGHTLSLRTELELTRKYLDLEQARFGNRLSVEWRVDESLLDCRVPSLIVLPLVENAIRHGLSPKVGPGRLAIGVRSEGPFLVLAVEDDGRGAALPLCQGLGVGNTRARLGALYGERAALDIETATDAGFRARIRIPLHEARS